MALSALEWLQQRRGGDEQEKGPAEQAMLTKMQQDAHEEFATQQSKLDEERMGEVKKPGFIEGLKKTLLLPEIEAGAVGAGARVANVGMGVADLFGADTEGYRAKQKRVLDPLKEEFPKSVMAGEIVADMAMTAPLGLGAGGVVAKGLASKAPGLSALAQRGITGLGAGGAEGLVIGLAEDNVAAGTAVGATLGATLEMALPPALRGASNLIRKIMGKTDDVVKQVDGALVPTDELDAALEKIGLKFDDIKGVDITDLPDNMTPDQMARRILFEKKGIPTTKARITQDAEDFAGQVRLERMVGDDGADLVRTRISEESAAMQNKLKELSEELGISDQGGETIKKALIDLDSGQRDNIKKAYKTLEDMAKETNAFKIPLARDRIREAIDEALLGPKPVSDETRDAIQRAAAKFGLFGGEPVKKGFNTSIIFDDKKISFAGRSTPLNLGNFEEFRQALNQAFQKDSTGSITAVKRALDDTVLEATEILGKAGDSKAFIQEAAEKARQTVIGRSQTLDTGTLVPKLLQENTRTGSPFVEASMVENKIFSAATPPEEVTRLMNALKQSGEGGKDAIKNLQSNTVLRLMDKAFKNAGKLTGGQTPFNVTAFTNELRSIGEKKLDVIFKNNKAALKSLKEFETIGNLMRTPSSAVQKGGHPDMVNAIIRASRLSAGLGGDIIGMAAAQLAGKQYTAMNNRAIRKSIIEMTDLNEAEAIKFMTKTYPELAAVLGLTVLGTREALDDGR